MTQELEERYLRTQWFEDRDEDVKLQRRRMVTTRKPKTCCGNGTGKAHEMPKGSRMFVETALYEGSWASWALCTDCMDSWLRTIGDVSAEQTSAERKCEATGKCLCWNDGQWMGDNC